MDNNVGRTKRRHKKYDDSVRWCIHGRQKYNCGKCGGAGICEHGGQKHYCKPCDGAGICEHNRRKYYCRQCGGAGICEHDKSKYYCKKCSGGGICEHDKHKYSCKKCSGAGRKRRRKLCGGVVDRSDSEECLANDIGLPRDPLPDRTQMIRAHIMKLSKKNPAPTWMLVAYLIFLGDTELDLVVKAQQMFQREILITTFSRTPNGNVTIRWRRQTNDPLAFYYSFAPPADDSVSVNTDDVLATICDELCERLRVKRTDCTLHIAKFECSGSL